MIKYDNIKEILDKNSILELTIDYNQRQIINKKENEKIARKVVEEIAYDPDFIPGNTEAKLIILLATLIRNNENGKEIAKKILESYNYNTTQELLVALQFIDDYNNKNIDYSFFSFLMNSLISINSFKENKHSKIQLKTEAGTVKITPANKDLKIPNIPEDNRHNQCHQITSLMLLQKPQMYGAYYYVPLSFKGTLEHSIIIDEKMSKVYDFANNATIDFKTWQKLLPNYQFIIKGQDFQDLYYQILDDYNEHINIATLEEIQRKRRKK